jgi:hypothetical protein
LRTRAQAEIDLLIPLISEKPNVGAPGDPKLWEVVKKCAARHGVAQLVAYAVHPHVSEAEKAWCDAVLARSWSSYRRSYGDLERIAARLQGRGIQVLALKGPLLAARHYDPAFLRMPSSDLDIAVRERDLEAACAALGEEGYASKLSLRAARRFSHHIAMIHPAGACVELHFRLTHGPFGPSTDGFFEGAGNFRLPGGAEVLVLEGAAEIFHLALHVVCGRFRPFFHLWELHRICAKAGPDAVREASVKAAECHFAGAFALLDVAFRACWGEPLLPPGFSIPATWLNSRIDEKLYRAFCRWSALETGHTLGSRVQGRWLDIQTTDRPSDALRQLAMLMRFAWFHLRNTGPGGEKKIAEVEG